MLPPPPYEMEDNAATWLAETDLVFIDPVGTGYSRAAKPELGDFPDGVCVFSVPGDRRVAKAYGIGGGCDRQG